MRRSMLPAIARLMLAAEASNRELLAENQASSLKYSKSTEDISRELKEEYLNELDRKGLQEYTIQGETIIAHSHDEAWKRYNHRHKSKRI